MGWLDGWLYRQAVVVENPNNQDLTDYQVRIVLDSSWEGWSRANDDGSDLRFTEDDGKTFLPYYVEKWDNTNEEAVIWVKVPYVPASGETIVYLYYGNVQAVSESDGEAVFEVFDDFDTADYTVIKGDANQVSISNSWLRIDATSGYSDTNDIRVRLNKVVDLQTDFIVEARVKHIDKDESVELIVEEDGKGYGCGWYGWSGTKGYIYRWDGLDSPTFLKREIPHYVASNGDIQVLRWDRVGNELRLWDTDGDTIIETATDGTYTHFTSVTLRVHTGAIREFDWARVRKYAEQEPSVSLASVEFVGFGDWLIGWKYRRGIVISEEGGQDLTDYQVRLVLDSTNFDFSNANADGSDLRFMLIPLKFRIENPNNQDLEDFQVKLEHSSIVKGKKYRFWVDKFDSPLPYWVEGDGVAWVKVPSIPANGVVDVYMIEDDSAPIEDGEAVFEFFDDFEGTELDTSKWDIYNSPQISLSNSVLTISGTHSITTSPEMIKSKTVFGAGYALEARVNQDFTGANAGGIGFAEGNGYTYPPSTNVAMYVDKSKDDDIVSFLTVDGANRNYFAAGSYAGGWTTFVLERSDSSVYFKFASYDWTSTQYLPQGGLPVHVGGYQSDAGDAQSFTMQIDCIFVRKHAEQELVVTVFENNVGFYGFLPYWIEEWDSANSYGVVWVKVPFLPANGSVTVYMYYGNSSVVSESNGEAVFEFFDDFEGDSLDTTRWAVHGTPTLSFSNSIMSISGNTFWQGIYSVVSVPTTNEIAEVKFRNIVGDYHAFTMAFGSSADDINGWKLNEWGTSNSLRLVDPPGNIVASTSFDYTPDVWYIQQITIDTTDDRVIGRVLDSSGVVLQELINSGVGSLYDRITLFHWPNAAETHEVDWVRVRKYAEQEPSISVGSEEKGVAPISGVVQLSGGSGVANQNVLIINEDTNDVELVVTSDAYGNYDGHGFVNARYTVVVIPSDLDKNGDIKCHIQL